MTTFKTNVLVMFSYAISTFAPVKPVYMTTPVVSFKMFFYLVLDLSSLNESHEPFLSDSCECTDLNLVFTLNFILMHLR